MPDDTVRRRIGGCNALELQFNWTGTGHVERVASLETKFEIEQLIISYWRDVDTRWGADAHNYFVKDGVFVSDNMRLEGRGEIQAFYDWRRGRGERIARHIVNNLQVSIEDDDHPVARYIMTIFAGDGVPVLPVR